MFRRPSMISVIVSTYNMPLWLEKTLMGYCQQDFQNFEIIVADDGSTDETAAVVQHFRKRMKQSIQHVWHPDDGFQKCKILNQAILAARGDYVLFSDGDCIPRSDFVATHFRQAAPGRFLSGGYYKLPMSISERIGEQEINTGQAFSLPWLWQHGLSKTPRNLRLQARGVVAGVCNRMTTTRPTWNGHNASGWTDDIHFVNGFDERMRYGGEDRELGERLENLRIRGKQIRYQAICVHLDHSRGYVSDEDWQRNEAIRKATREQKRTFTAHGIRQGQAVDQDGLQQDALQQGRRVVPPTAA